MDLYQQKQKAEHLIGPSAVTSWPNAVFFKEQQQFTAYLRDPSQVTKPQGIEPRRLKIYQDLLFNNICGFIASAFPVVKKVLDSNRWQVLAKEFFTQHSADTPYFLGISQEFLTFLHQRKSDAQDPPFLLELAYYEWLDLQAQIVDVPSIVGFQQKEPTIQQVPILSPAIFLHSFNYPVHQIGPDCLPEAPLDKPLFLVVYRKLSGKVGFLQLNQASAMMLQLLLDNKERKTVYQLVMASMGEVSSDWLQHLTALLCDWHQKQLIWGSLVFEDE